MADLYASGWVRKLQDHWKPTVAVEVCAMALALAFMAGGEKVATPADKAVGSIQVYAGKFSYDPSYVWPQYMLMSNWSVWDFFLSRSCPPGAHPPRNRIPPTMILIWVEVSHAMQWFFSWGIFVWTGKISYGFYLMQFLTLYGLMPIILLHFAEQNRSSYWNVVTPTYILCLMFNFFVAW